MWQTSTEGDEIEELGRYRAMDVPGPPKFEAWLSCWKVNRAILFMLRQTGNSGLEHKVITQATSEEYMESFKSLVLSFRSAGTYAPSRRTSAEAELMPRLRRSLERAAMQGEIVNTLTYDRDRPWDSVFRAARDDLRLPCPWR